MKKIELYNTLERKKQEFKPIISGEVGLYTCGPTVYNFAHIGNLRAYIFEDILKRVLRYNGYKVKHVMNITDVGHLTGDMDMGEDKMEKGSKREGKTAWEVAEFYTEAFMKDIKALNIEEPNIWCKATDYIKEQVIMIRMLEEKGYTYVISDGVYFDTSKVKEYNKLSHLKLEDLQEGARVEKNDEKKNPTDFALWKFSYPGGRAFDPSKDKEEEKRQMEWETPWGLGFPGWHLECSAMSAKELGKQLDIHCGGIDHINVHHTNEIAQSEAASGEKFFNYWMHGAFLNIEGGKKMAKSDDNFLTLENAFLKKGMDPLVYRFATLQTHYRKPMEYSEEGMKNASKGFEHLRNQVRALGEEAGNVNEDFKSKFTDAINDDLNTPQALAVVQEVLKSDMSSNDKLATVFDFDIVLGLGLGELDGENINIESDEMNTELYIEEGLKSIPEDDLKWIREKAPIRNLARKNKDWAESDRLRDQFESRGYIIKDTNKGMEIKKK